MSAVRNWTVRGFAAALLLSLFVLANPVRAQASSFLLPVEQLGAEPTEQAPCEGIVAQRAKVDTVMNTYRVYTGLLNGKAVADVIYDVTYKQLRFTNSYTQIAPKLTGIDPVGMDGTYIPELNGVAVSGSIEYWTCQYKLY